MKILKYIAVWVLSMALFASCNEGIDPINPVAPGSDTEAPTVAINNPEQGGLIIAEEGAGLAVDLVAEDDIELESVSIHIDGSELENVTEFMDYRRYAPIGGYIVEGLETGSHTIKIIATDKSGKTTTSAEVAFTVVVIGSFTPAYGEIFYMSFDNTYLEYASVTEPAIIGAPGFFDGKILKAYAGDTDAYLEYPLETLANAEFSATFWYNVNSTPGRSGILTASPPDASNNLRTSGFRLFREGSETEQILKLNVGIGEEEVWLDGGAAATITVEETEWVHIAMTLSATHAALYFDGAVVSEAELTAPFSWAACESLTIGSGMPNFIGWDHLSDLSLIDELRIYDRALTQEEIQTIVDAEQ
ncbi:MAG: LamG domain-containing protein [Bacteroides sp.]|nr:LamG domain-containing protein [Bacteroides sp.]